MAALLVVCLAFGPAIAQKAGVAAGQSKFAEQRGVEYIVGNLPLIVAAPHGGRLEPASIPNRTKGVLTTDTNTDRCPGLFQADGRLSSRHRLPCQTNEGRLQP